MKLELRDYQALAFQQAREHIRNGARSVLINAPTGSGKTVLASALMERSALKGTRATFVVDRLSLIDQTSKMFASYELDHGVIQGSHPNFRPKLPIQVCSVQTLARRAWPDSQLDVFDEAHILHKAHKARLAQKQSIIIGLTATPFTKGLGKYFDAVVNVTTTRDLIEKGWLSPYRIFSCREPDMRGVQVKSTGEWDEKQTSDRAMNVVGDVVREYAEHGMGRKFICSAVDTVHVQELARQFLSRGINVATYTYKDRDEDRADTVTEFRKPDSQITGLITVTAASRGFDVADVSCIIMARPLRKSLAEHIQLFGRGLRISPATGKKDCLVLDHSGNAARFYLDCEAFFDDGIDALDEHKAKERQAANDREPRLVKCPQCGYLHTPRDVCPECGYEYPPKIAVAHIPGTLRELISGGYHKELTQNVWPQICHYVLQKKDGEAARKHALALYRDIVGDWPRRKFENTTPKPPTLEVLNKIRAHNIAYANRRSRGL